MENIKELDRAKKLFSERLGALIQNQGVQQNILADKIGVSESTVGKWLLKKALPRMGAIQKLSDYFRVPKSYFLEEDFDNANAPAAPLPNGSNPLPKGSATLSQDESLVLSKYRRLSPDGKEYIHDQLNFRLDKEAADAKKETHTA